jgi:threonine dehydrogenase-like Zn-dependent dehydrogenase
MKAVVSTDYGVIAVREMAEPEPGPQQILVRVRAGALCKTDIGMIQQGILDIKPPVIIGHEVTGVVESMGADVQGLQIGQLVALDPPVPCRECRVCRAGLRHLCPNTQHIGAPRQAAWPNSSPLTTETHTPFRPNCRRSPPR